MKVHIEEGCTACALCTETCPEVFRLGDDGCAEVYDDITDDTSDSAADAADSCPAGVIIIDK